MKNLSARISRKRIFLLFSLLTLFTLGTKGAEFVIMNRIISWDINAQDAFWTIMPDATMPTNWASPDDYYHGTIYTRYEVLDVATNTPFGMQFGIFQWNPDRNHRLEDGELCETVQSIHGVGAIVTHSSSPSTWWQANGGVDFSRVIDFSSMSPIIYSMDTGYPVGKPGEGGDKAGKSWSQRFNWFPVTLRVTVVAVSKNSTFSGWSKYIIDPSLRQPTPNYGIDYINETTDKVVPSTDQFSIYSGMSYAIDGTGQKMPITPGQDANFRTKAGGGLLISETQHFRAPCRPATPTFVLDKVNHQTTTTVGNNYEYSDFANMSGAVTGSGTYVTIPAGTTKYFRKKATSSSFKSNVQALAETNRLPIAHELLIFNDTIEYPNTTDSNGFYYFYYNSDMPVNWKSPDDYYNGEVFARYEIISEKTEAPVGMQFGIWQMMPPETGELHETMSEIAGMNGTGSVVVNQSSPRTWWKLDPWVDFTRMDLTWHFGINPWQVNPTSKQIRQENPDVWGQRSTNWFPMKVYVTIVAVASNTSFSGWNNYIKTNGSKKPMPSIGLDFVNEQTDVIPSTVEYSVKENMSDAVNGSGQKLAVTPGQDLYFRTKPSGNMYASDIQHLVVPARPAAPAFTIDFIHKNTAQGIPANVEYSDTSSFTYFAYGTGLKINILPGQKKYFRTVAGSSAFMSEVLELIGPAQQAGPAVTINYANESTNEVLSSSVDYSLDAVMADATACNNTTLALTPGKKYYFRENATDSTYVSLISSLDVPARPSAPVISVDFEQEKTVQNISDNLEYDVSSSFNNHSVGTGSQIAVVPGQDLYFRQKAGNTSFAGEILHLIVPNKILLGYAGADTIAAEKFEVYAVLNGAVNALIPENIQVINGSVRNMQNGNVFDVYPEAIGPVLVVIPVNSIAGGNFASNEIAVYNSWIPTGVKDLNGDLFRIFPNPSKDRIITIQAKSNASYLLDVYSEEGSLLKTFKMTNSEYQKIDLNDLQNGLYFIKINTNNKVTVQKIVLE